MSGTVFVVDDDELVGQTVCLLLETFGIEAEQLLSGAALLERRPLPLGSCVISDVRMPGMSGLALVEALNELGESAPVILLTGYADVDLAVAAFRKGAIDFLRKPFSSTELVEVVQRSLRLAADAADRLRTARHARERLDSLSGRELEVARLLVQGRSNKDVGRDLGISYRTVEHHRRQVMDKAECGSLVQLEAMLRQAEGK